MPVELVLTAIARDRPGIVEALADVVTRHSGNWVDSSMARLGGEVQKVVGSREYAVVFQENIIRRMVYQGGNAVFDIQPVDERRGTLIPTSVVGWGRFVFSIAPEGFMVFDGVESTSIGENHVDDEFYDHFDSQNHYLLASAIDPVLKNVMWSFPGEGNTGNANKVFVYHWPEQKWSVLDQELTCIGNMGRPGYTLDGLDAVSSSLDDDTLLGPSLDAEKWKGGTQAFGGFDAQNFLGFFDGANAAAAVTAAEIQLNPAGRARANGLRPIVQSGDRAGIVGSFGVRENTQDAPVFTQGNAVNPAGLCNARADGRYHRGTVSITSSVSWSIISGVRIEYEELGDR